jgi:hypothetical protein
MSLEIEPSETAQMMSIDIYQISLQRQMSQSTGSTFPHLRSKLMSVAWKSVMKGCLHQTETLFGNFSFILLTLASTICFGHKRGCLEGDVWGS